MTVITNILAGIWVWLIAIAIIIWSLISSVAVLLIALLIAVVSLPKIIIEQF